MSSTTSSKSGQCNHQKNQVVIEAGKLRLEFGCSSEPVPWDFMYAFVQYKLDAVNRGFAEEFLKEWWHEKDDQSRICYVGFRGILGQEECQGAKGDKIIYWRIVPDRAAKTCLHDVTRES